MRQSQDLIGADANTNILSSSVIMLSLGRESFQGNDLQIIIAKPPSVYLAAE